MRLVQRLNGECTEWLEEIHQCFPNSFTDVWLSTAYGYPTLEKHKELSEKLTKHAKMFREQGIRVSLQLSNTIGHGQYMAAKDCSALQNELKDATRLVGHDGTVAEYSFCWRDKSFLAYVEEEIGLYVNAVEPEEVWIDDDLRANNHTPVRYGCFCKNCVETFNRQYGYQYDRETLVMHIDESPHLKQQWIAFLQEGLSMFVERICKKIVSIKADVAIGLQNGPNGYYAGFGYDYLLDAIRRTTKTPPMYRAGAGAYQDHNPNELVEKAYCLAYQYAILPEYVSHYYAEIENTPNTAFGKTMYGTTLEATLNFVLGTTDCSFAMLGVVPEEKEFYEHGFKNFHKCFTYWKKITELTKHSDASGVWFAHAKAPHLSGYMVDNSYERVNDLLRCGIPVAHDPKGCKVILLHPEVARQMQKEEIIECLKRDVLTDAATVSYIQKQGIDLGFEINAMTPNDSIYYREVYTEHPINKEPGGSFKTGFFSNGYGGHCLIAEYPSQSEVIGRYSRNGELQEVSDLIFTTNRGGRWAVVGYGLWKSNIPTKQRNRIQDMIEYIHPAALPARILSAVQAILIPRISKEDGSTIVTSYVNCTIEAQENVRVKINRPYGEQILLHSLDGMIMELKCEREEESMVVTIPAVKPWEVVTLEIKRKDESL